jgi:hypothetical protein
MNPPWDPVTGRQPSTPTVSCDGAIQVLNLSIDTSSAGFALHPCERYLGYVAWLVSAFIGHHSTPL